MLKGMAFVSLIFAAFCLDNLIAMSRCSIKVYDKHVEGRGYSFGFRSNSFHCTYAQIQSTQMGNGAVKLNVGNKNYTVMCKAPQELYDVLNRQIAAD